MAYRRNAGRGGILVEAGRASGYFSCGGPGRSSVGRDAGQGGSGLLSPSDRQTAGVSTDWLQGARRDHLSVDTGLQFVSAPNRSAEGAPGDVRLPLCRERYKDAVTGELLVGA